MNWYLKVLKQYKDFRGRACRREYWMFVLINMLISIVPGLIDYLIGLQIVTWIYSLVILVPSLAVTVRRLHDVGKSGWYYFICLIPLIGWIWLIVLLAKKGQPETNEWGVNPLNC